MMKIKCFLFVALFSAAGIEARSQSYEIEQLILDWQKLSELKSILSDLYKGYQILSTGYETIRSISEGNFNLHKAFLDALLAVSPAVKNYKRVQDIIDYQAGIVTEYKSAFSRFRQDKHFTADEIAYLGTVYGNLFNQSLNDINNLINVITTSTLRMSDDERLHAIDGIYNSSKDQLMFLRSFNSSTTMLAVQRAADDNDVGTLQNLYGLK
jgi:hypothetical protein